MEDDCEVHVDCREGNKEKGDVWWGPRTKGLEELIVVKPGRRC